MIVSLALRGAFAALTMTMEIMPAIAARHPIHSSSATILAAPGSPTATIVLRAFADDFPPGTNLPAIRSYLAQRFRILDPEGRPVPLAVDSVRLDRLVVVTTLTAAIPQGLAGHRIWHGVLSERFSDQVNLVQARYGGHAVSLLFTATDSAKPLP